ncbi:MAG: hypothetical protein ACJAZX_001128 [Rickettsiales bacterium]|jgi:hypothetical protein
MLSMALAEISYGAFLLVKTKKFVKNSLQTTAIVWESEILLEGKKNNKDRRFDTIVEFQRDISRSSTALIKNSKKSIEFKNYVFESSSALIKTAKKYQVGDQIEILYSPKNHQDVRINNWMSLYFIIFSLMVIIPLTTFLCIFLLIIDGSLNVSFM